MLQRIITAVVALLIFIPVLIFAGTEAVFGITVFNIVMGILSAVGTYEGIKCVGGEKKLGIMIPSVILSFLTVTLTKNSLANMGLIFGVFLFYLLFIGVLFHEKLTSDTLLYSFGMVFYVTVSFSALAIIRVEKPLFFPLVFIIAWVTDTFAYFTGRFFGKHKLIPAVSPKKTVEGAVGGIIFCIIGCILYGIIMKVDTKTIILIALIGMIVSVISQLGDLSASLIKRHFDIKDYGFIFPGHGGVLDRFDSILAVSLFLLVFSLIKF